MTLIGARRRSTSQFHSRFGGGHARLSNLFGQSSQATDKRHDSLDGDLPASVVLLPWFAPSRTDGGTVPAGDSQSLGRHRYERSGGSAGRFRILAEPCSRRV